MKYYMSAGLLLISMAAISQPPPPATPIDGGLSVLLATGGALGLRKLLKKR